MTLLFVIDILQMCKVMMELLKLIDFRKGSYSLQVSRSKMINEKYVRFEKRLH